jgi:hypothetical protein
MWVGPGHIAKPGIPGVYRNNRAHEWIGLGVVIVMIETAA